MVIMLADIGGNSLGYEFLHAMTIVCHLSSNLKKKLISVLELDMRLQKKISIKNGGASIQASNGEMLKSNFNFGKNNSNSEKDGSNTKTHNQKVIERCLVV